MCQGKKLEVVAGGVLTQGKFLGNIGNDVGCADVGVGAVSGCGVLSAQVSDEGVHISIKEHADNNDVTDKSVETGLLVVTTELNAVKSIGELGVVHAVSGVGSELF